MVAAEWAGPALPRRSFHVTSQTPARAQLHQYRLIGSHAHRPCGLFCGHVSDVPGHLLKEIEHFFEVFKDQEGSEFGVLEWEELRRPKKLLEGAIRAGEESDEESATATDGRGRKTYARKEGTHVCGVDSSILRPPAIAASQPSMRPQPWTQSLLSLYSVHGRLYENRVRRIVNESAMRRGCAYPLRSAQ